MTKEDLIKLFDKYNEDISKEEKNKKRIAKINIEIKKIEEQYSNKITSSYEENSNIQTNDINSKIEQFLISKEEKIKEKEAEKKALEAENIILNDKTSDVKMLLKALKERERLVIEEKYIKGNSFEDIRK